MTTLNQLDKYYDEIDLIGCQAIFNNQEKLDSRLVYPSTDQRTGLSLVISMDHSTLHNVQSIYEELQPIEPYQYYYPLSDIHTTILSIVKMQNFYHLNREVIESYHRIFEDIVQRIPQFNILYKGLTISDNAVLLKGYYDYPMLRIREMIRNKLLDNGIHFRERYKPVAAHSTIIRFRNKLRNKDAFIRKIHEMKDLHIGYTCVRKIEFVYHDWYNTSFKKILLGSYPLGEKSSHHTI